MRKIKYLLICVYTLMLIMNLPQNVQASTGSITVTFIDDREIITDGEVIIYHVADVNVSDEEYIYQYTDEWKSCGILLKDVQSAAFAEQLEIYAKEQKIYGKKIPLDDKGSVRFTELQDGLYLVGQSVESKGYCPIKSFLLTIPVIENGEMIYNVEAFPKMEPETDKPDEENVPEDSEEPKKQPTKLPQTGQLNWPIPIMAIIGLILFTIGWYIRFAKKE